MVGSVVCTTVYTDGQPYKPCVLCQTGFSVVKYLTIPNMTIAVDWDVKKQTKPKCISKHWRP